GTSALNRATENGKHDEVQSAKSIITPELDRCTLNLEDHVFKPVSVISASLADHRVRQFRLHLEGASMSAFMLGEQKPQWTATAPGATSLVWLATDDKIIYLAAYQSDKGSQA